MNGNKLLFVNVNIDYLKALHDVDSEVQYSDEGYIRKPFLGILLLNNYKQYVVPLSSVKEKHLHWKKRYSDGRYLVTEIISRSSISVKPMIILFSHIFSRFSIFFKASMYAISLFCSPSRRFKICS